MIRFLLPFILLIASINVYSQHHEDDLRMIYVSLKAGLTNVSMIGQYNYGSGELSSTSSLQPHIYLGYGLDYATRSRYHIAIGYASYAQSQNQIIGGVLRSKKYNLKYLSAPLSYRHVIGKKRGYAWKTPNLYLSASFQFDYLIHSSTSWNINTESVDLTEYLQRIGSTDFIDNIAQDHGMEENFDDLYNNFDLKASLGVGLQYFILPNYLLYIQADYQYGFMDINNSSWRYENEANPYASVKSSGLLFSIGLNKYLKAF